MNELQKANIRNTLKAKPNTVAMIKGQYAIFLEETDTDRINKYINRGYEILK